MTFDLPIRAVCSVPIMAGVITISARYLMSHRDLFKKLRRWIWTTKSSSRASTRYRSKKMKFFAALHGLKCDRRRNERSRISQSRRQPGYNLHPSEACQAFEKIEGDVDNAFEDLLRYCDENHPVTFADVIPPWKLMTATQYGERKTDFLCFDADGSRSIFVCIQVRKNDHDACSTKSDSLGNVIPEVVSSLYLAKLRKGPVFIAPNFPAVHSVHYVEDKLLPFGRKHGKEEHIQEKAYVTIERNYCGNPLAKKGRDSWIGVSIIAQITAALSVAEQAYEFEHRSLHAGNIRLRNAKTPFLKYSTGTMNFAIETLGIHAYIFEFGKCRINIDGEIFYTEFDNFPEKMETNEENSEINDSCLDQKTSFAAMEIDDQKKMWCFNPKTNVVWIKHVIENVLRVLRQDQANNAQIVEDRQRQAVFMLESWSSSVLSNDSASLFLQNVIFESCPLVLFLATN